MQNFATDGGGCTWARGAAMGILFWINTYLEQHGGPSVAIDNPIMQEIVAWVEHEHAVGRDSAIIGEELEARAEQLLYEHD